MAFFMGFFRNYLILFGNLYFIVILMLPVMMFRSCSPTTYGVAGAHHG